MYFLYVAIISTWKNSLPLNWTNLNSLYPRNLFVMLCWNWPSGSGEEFQILLISPFWGGCNPSFNYNWTPPLPNDALCQVWLKLAKWFFSRRFLNDVNELSLCGYYLPLEKCMALKLAKWFLSSRFLNGVNEIPLCGYYLRLKKCLALKFHKSDYLYPRILCVMFGWNWPSGSGEDFQKLSIFFSIFAIISP